MSIAHCLAGTNSAFLTPFFQLRETTLGYHGPSDDFTNLTEIRLGWFGPTNLNDPLTGDLWWAANLAVRETNEQRTMQPERGVHAASTPELSRASANTKPLFISTSKRPEGRAPVESEDSSFQSLPIRLIPRWSVDPWGTGVSQLTRMVYDDQPLALLGSVDSASTHLAEQVVAKANLPLVSPISTDKSVTLAGVSWMFSCAPSDAAIARVLVPALLKSLHANAASYPQPSRGADGAVRAPNSAPGARAATNSETTFALLTCTDHESRMTAREIMKEFSRRGHSPDFRFDVSLGVTDISRHMQALAEAKPGVVVIIAGAAEAARLVRAVRERLGGVSIFGSHTMGRTPFLKLAGPAAEGVRFPLLFHASKSETNAARLGAQFAAERGHAPDYAAAFTYDATRLLVEAVRRAGPNRARVREAMTELSPWTGVAGRIQFDGTGQNTQAPFGMGTIRDGSIVPLPLSNDSTQTASNH